jgi:addiction module HigA family antidote
VEVIMASKRDLGQEILQGILELKRGRTGRVTRVPMHNPPHPGEIIKSLCLEPLGLTVTAAAKGLGVTRKTLTAILDERAGVSAEMAVRLSIAFNTSAEIWLKAQLKHDLWHAEALRKKLRVMKLAA